MKAFFKTLLILSVGTASYNVAFGDEDIDSTNLRTIKAGSHTYQENQINAKRCAEYGMTDITNTIDLQLSENASDPLVCYSSNVTTNSDFPGLDNYKFTQGSFPYGPYKIYSSATYQRAFNHEIAVLIAAVPTDNCNVSGSIQTEPSAGQLYIETTCSYPNGRRGAREIQTQYGWANGPLVWRYGTINLQ